MLLGSCWYMENVQSLKALWGLHGTANSFETVEMLLYIYLNHSVRVGAGFINFRLCLS